MGASVSTSSGSRNAAWSWLRAAARYRFGCTMQAAAL
jgi:hypothetical protein